MAAGGLITLIRSVPTMIESFRIGTRQLRDRWRQGATAILRTDRDLPLTFMGGGVLVLIVALALVPHVFGQLERIAMRAMGAALVALFAFFFVTVSSRIVGLVGVTSNPTSGMTIASLLGTSATFVALAVMVLDRAYGLGTPELPAPQVTLMKVVIEGVLQKSLPWILVGLGVGLALVAELLHIPSLPFAVGVYLPLSAMVSVFLGGALRGWLQRTAKNETEADRRKEQGILVGSGLVGGEGLLGVGIAAVAFLKGRAPHGIGFEWVGPWAPIAGLVAFALLVAWFRSQCRTPGEKLEPIR